MKRCPQCEFIYEDDQSLCDMDGILLVFDSQKLPKPVTDHKSPWGNRIVSGSAIIILGTVLFLVSYVSTHQRPNVNSSLRPAAISVTPLVEAAPVKEPALETASDTDNSSKNENVKATAPVAKASGNKKSKASSETRNANEKPKTVVQPKTTSPAKTEESDSKVGSLLKKTGRILKKPFKF